MREKHDCDLCRRTWALYDEEPDCIECMPVTLMECNQDKLKVYNQVKGQIIFADCNPVDINILAVKVAMDIYGIENDASFFEIILRLVRLDIKRMRDEQEAKRKMQ